MKWPLVNLPDICRPKQWPTIPKKKMLSSGFPVYGANGRIGYFSEYNHEEPTILITCRGATCGTINVCEPKSYVTGNAMALDDLDASRVNLRFLTRALESADFSSVITGVAQPQITRQTLSRLQIPLPPLAEQKRMAGILDAADALRAKRREALAQLDTLLQSTFLDMFGDPVTNPMGWPIRPLGEVAENKDSMRIPVKQSDRDQRSGKYPYYGSVGIIDDIDDYLFEGPHLLISEDGKHLESRNRPIICLADGRFWVNNHAHVLASNGHAELIFLAHNLELRPIRQYVTGIDQFKLNRKKMDIIPVPLPPLDLQRRFAALVESIDHQKARMRAHLVELDALFASVQSRAFNGEL